MLLAKCYQDLTIQNDDFKEPLYGSVPVTLAAPLAFGVHGLAGILYNTNGHSALGLDRLCSRELTFISL